jgi:hypothetical protein
MTVDRLPDGTADRPLATFIDATQDAVQAALDVDELGTDYKAIAHMSGHLAAMWRTVYPHANGTLGADGQLRAVCLSRAREVEWSLRLFQCHVSGAAHAVGHSATAVWTLLTQRLDSYRSAERALVTWLEDQLAAEGRERLATKYRHTLSHAPTRPHPRSPRTGPLCVIVFWLHSRWDRVLDTVDSRPGVGGSFLPPPLDGEPACPADGGDGPDQDGDGPVAQGAGPSGN